MNCGNFRTHNRGKFGGKMKIKNHCSVHFVPFSFTNVNFIKIYIKFSLIRMNQMWLHIIKTIQMNNVIL